jgi:hypothetical protein
MTADLGLCDLHHTPAYKLPAESEHQVGLTRIIEAAYALAKLVQR